jgi:excinuclease UvrABC nuclease subunit
MMKAKKKYKGQLVFQYVEKISRELLERYRQVIRDIARGKHGIYALYKDERIYYVGLASNLRQRLGHHLRDRHKKTWNRFSIYLTTSSENLKDLESLFLRIFKPKGNTKVGKFYDTCH